MNILSLQKTFKILLMIRFEVFTTVKSRKVLQFMNSCCGLVDGYQYSYPEDGWTVFLRNTGIHLREYNNAL
jgi:hypothetical protein